MDYHLAVWIEPFVRGNIYILVIPSGESRDGRGRIASFPGRAQRILHRRVMIPLN